MRVLGRVVVMLAALTVRLGEATASTHPSALFPSPPGLQHQVDFWKDVFTIYSSKHVVIHDREALDRVYSVLDFRYLDGFPPGIAERVRKKRVQEEIERVRAALVRLQQLGPDSPALNDTERRIAAEFPRGSHRGVFREAAAVERLRAQSGLSDKFQQAIEIAHAYWPKMERIFREYGLPAELTRLPLIESCFNLKAYSRVGAAGIWQFMPATGRMYLRIDEAVDERRDPVVSTHAAAQHLKENYEILGTWPLAITAYNHGRGGMARAIAELGTTDIVQVIQRYRGRTFGFASKNFYAEFLAALEVERNADRYFKDLQPHPPRSWHSAVLPDYVSLTSLARVLKVPRETLIEMNPALSARVISGDLHIPKGYRLWLPPPAAAMFSAAYARLSAGERHETQRRAQVVHRVQPGDTLGKIARRYGTTVSAIVRQNGLRNSHQIRVGQVLRISAAPTTPASTRAGQSHSANTTRAAA